MNTITIKEARELFEIKPFTMHIKYINVFDEKVTVYPSSIEEAIDVKNRNDSAYSIWLHIDNELRCLINDDGTEIQPRKDHIMRVFNVQLDVTELRDQYAICNLYTGSRCVQIVLQESQYKQLIEDKFFIRDGQSRDSAGVLNTTQLFTNKKLVL